MTQTPLAETPQILESTPQQIQAFRDACYTRAYRSRPHLLIVEDQAFTISLMHGLLAREYEVRTAANAVEAWQSYLEVAPDIVFLDIEMPGIDGHTLAAALRELDSGAFVVMVTGNHCAEDVQRARANGVQGFIAKPFSKQKLLEAIQKFARNKKKTVA
jgi:two-component system chemotaxis response regulator CheY